MTNSDLREMVIERLGMKCRSYSWNCRRATWTLITIVLVFAGIAARSLAAEPDGLWAHDRLIPWVVGVYDEKPLKAEERPLLLKRLGFKKFAYFWEPDPKDIRIIDEEIETLKRHGLEPTAWWFSYDAADPFAKQLLEAFKRHDIHPQLWVSP